jgi:hypothetical protein
LATATRFDGLTPLSVVSHELSAERRWARKTQRGERRARLRARPPDVRHGPELLRRGVRTVPPVARKPVRTRVVEQRRNRLSERALPHLHIAQHVSDVVHVVGSAERVLTGRGVSLRRFRVGFRDREPVLDARTRIIGASVAPARRCTSCDTVRRRGP